MFFFHRRRNRLLSANARATNLNNNLSVDHPTVDRQLSPENQTVRSRVSNDGHLLVVVAVNHLAAFVVILYGLYVICRFGFGWDPTHDPPPPTYTVHIRGVTDDVQIFD